MKRGIPPILAGIVFASGCSGTRRSAVPVEPVQTPAKTAASAESVPLHDYLLHQRRYAQAAAAFTQVNLQTATIPDPETKFRYERLAQLLSRAGFTAVPAREEKLRRETPAADLANKAILAFLRERDRQSLLYAAAAAGSDPGETAFRLLLQALEASSGRAAEAGERQPPERVAAYKLRRANALFKDKRYEDAAAQCREALLLSPENSAVYERLGSMYYALGAKERAVEAWRESLRLNPGNAPLKDFMARLESAGPATRTP